MKKFLSIIIALAAVVASPLTFSQETDSSAPVAAVEQSGQLSCVQPNQGVRFGFELSTVQPQIATQLKVVALQSLRRACFVDKPDAKNTMLVSLSKKFVPPSGVQRKAVSAGIMIIASAFFPPAAALASGVPQDRGNYSYEVGVLLYDESGRDGSSVYKAMAFESPMNVEPTPEQFREALQAVLREFDPVLSNRASSR